MTEQSSSPLLVVFGYGGPEGQDIADRHRPYWERSGCDILTVSPYDNALAPGGFTWGKDAPEKEGMELAVRHLETFKFCLRLRYESFWFIESDSIVLGTLPSPVYAQAVVFQNWPNRYVGKYYYHWPWGFLRGHLQWLVRAAATLPFTNHYGVPDRWLGALAQHAKLQIAETKLGWSTNRINSDVHVAAARKAISNGVLVIHGIKTESELDAIVRT